MALRDFTRRYDVITDTFGPFARITLRDNNTNERVSILPGYGANVNEIVLQKNGKLHSIIEGAETPDELLANKWFKGAKLTPWPGRIRDGKYTFHGKEHQLPINMPEEHHAIHGLLYDKPFAVLPSLRTDRLARVELVNNHKPSPGYPFTFETLLTYTLSDEGFSCKTRITNKGDTDMPVGDGWHPYYRLGPRVDALMLKIPARQKIITDERNMPIDARTSKLFREFARIGNLDLDDGFIPEYALPTVQVFDPVQDVTINAWQEKGGRLDNQYNYIQIFIPPSRTSIAIEPMTCQANAFNNKRGLIVLSPGETFKGNYGVKLT